MIRFTTFFPRWIRTCTVSICNPILRRFVIAWRITNSLSIRCGLQIRNEHSEQLRFTTFFCLFFIIVMATACTSPAVQEQVSPSLTVAEKSTPTQLSATPNIQTPAPTVSVPTAIATKVMRTVTVMATSVSTETVTPLASATLMITATVTPPPTVTPMIYTVKPGDTLFSIALNFGITIKKLTTANDIDENSFLQIGQKLMIPFSPQPTQTATVDSTTAPSMTAINIAPVLPTAAPLPTLPPLPAISHAANVNPLTGLSVSDPTKLQRRPILVRIGNDVEARPSQIGLNQADMVYEEIVEWWLTRFTAIFLSESPTLVAPIRSARLINVQLAPQYQAALAHSGGSDPVRWEISQTSIVNLDQFYVPSPYYFRPNQGWQTRAAMDVEKARRYLVSKELEAAVSLAGFLFNDTISGEKGEAIYIPYPQATSFTVWRYDAARGKYLRWINGTPLVDVGDGTQISAANVIIYFADHQETDVKEDSTGATSIRIIVNGRGSAWFFRDGKLNKGFWQTDGSRTPYFSYEDGRAYELKSGNSWVEVVPTYFTIGVNSEDEAKAKP